MDFRIKNRLIRNVILYFAIRQRSNLSKIGAWFFLSLLLMSFSPLSAQDNKLAKTLEKLNSYEEKWNFYSSSKIAADSLEFFLTNDITNNHRLELLLFYRNKIGIRNASKGKKEALEALEIAKELNKPLQQAMALRYLLLSNSMSPVSGKSMSYANEALEIAKSINDPILEADIYTSMFFVHKQRENDLEAIKYFIKSVDLVHKYGGHSIKNIKHIATSRISLENNNVSLANKTLNKVDYSKLNIRYKRLYMRLKNEILIRKNDWDSLQFYYDKMLRDLPTGETFEIIADGYLQKEDLELALNFYHRAVAFKEIKSEYSSMVFLKLSEIYDKKGVYDSTEIYLKRSLENAIRLEKKHDLPKIYTALASFYLEQEQFPKSKRYANKGYTLARIANLTESLAEITKVLSRVLAQEDEFEKAHSYLEENRRYTEKLNKRQSLEILQKTEIDRELAMWSENLEREIAYEVEKKDQAIAVLTAENRVKTLQARQQRNLRISLIIGTLMLVALLLILWSRFRLKKKALRNIREKNEENLLLMREIHHRVKNNLQIILSLLNAQANTLKGSKELNEALVESQNKIKSMAIIHQNLYNSNNFVYVPSGKYLNELIDHIKNSYNDDKENVNFEIQIEDGEINMAMAVPLGLIVNELLTNSYKYAFTNSERENTLMVKFYQTEVVHTYKLEVQDNGRGLPDNFNIDELPSFGMQLVKGLVEQLEGEINIYNTNVGGTAFEIYVKQPTAS